MKYCTNIIVYIFDLSDATYSLVDQKKLFQQILDLDRDIIIYLSKTDIVDNKKIKEFISKFDKKYKVFSKGEDLIAEVFNLEKEIYD